MCLSLLVRSEECSSNYTNSQCGFLDVSHPSIIFQDQKFYLSIGGDSNTISNISLFATLGSFCGRMSQGHLCIINSLLNGTIATVTCPSTSDIDAGQVNLIIGLTGCFIHSNVTLGQSKLSL